MDHFTYRDRVLHCDDVPVPTLAEILANSFGYETAAYVGGMGAQSDAVLFQGFQTLISGSSFQAVQMIGLPPPMPFPAMAQ